VYYGNSSIDHTSCPQSIIVCKTQQFQYTGIASEKGSFLRRVAETEKALPKRVKPLSKHILDFGLPKGKSPVEFREGF
jgi:hypothetical protein